MPASELIERLGDDELLVVDCRDGESGWPLTELKIPGALRMTVQELQAAGTALPDDELIVLCGANDDHSDVHRAWRILMGVNRRAVCLHGGFHGWVSSGFPTERDQYYSAPQQGTHR